MKNSRIVFVVLLFTGAMLGGRWAAHWWSPPYRSGDFSGQFAHSEADVLLYVLPDCDLCIQAKQELLNAHFRVEERVLGTAPEYALAFRALGVEKVPTAVFRSRVYEGYRADQFPAP